MENRIDTLELEVRQLRKELQEIKSLLRPERQKENHHWKSNAVGDWMIKLVYPGIYAQKDKPEAGFPRNRRKIADQILPGQKMFIYVTSPIKKIIGLTRVTDQMIVRDDSRWPFSVSLEWEIGPIEKGISLESVGLDIRPRPGDTLFGISDDIAQNIIQLLKNQPDLTDEQHESLSFQYRELYKKPVSFSDALQILRDSGENNAAETLESFFAVDGTRRGWDEYVSKGSFFEEFPKVRSIIWPETFSE